MRLLLQGQKTGPLYRRTQECPPVQRTVEEDDMGDEIVLLITTPSDDEAATIAHALVHEHLVACANIISGIRSVFFWEGETRDERESLVILKSRRPLMEAIIPRVKELHSYAEPEIIALPISAGSQSYLNWIGEVTKEVT